MTYIIGFQIIEFLETFAKFLKLYVVFITAIYLFVSIFEDFIQILIPNGILPVQMTVVEMEVVQFGGLKRSGGRDKNKQTLIPKTIRFHICKSV